MIESDQEGLFTLETQSIEAMKQRAKQHHLNMRGDEFTSGIVVRHLYDDTSASAD